MEIILELPDAKVDDLLNLCDILAELSKQPSLIQNGKKKDCSGKVESMECQETIRPYIRMLSERIASNECLVKGNSIKLLSDMVFRHKKLLPYDGSRVKVSEYADYVTVFTMEGRHVVDLYKNRFCSD